MSLLATREELQSEIASMKTLVESSSGGAFVDILNGNEIITFESNNQIKQCPTNCMLCVSGTTSTVYISGSGEDNSWTSIVLAYGMCIPLKAGTFVKTADKSNTYLLPCSKYTKNEWYFTETGKELSIYLTSGTYEFVAIGGGGGSAALVFYEASNSASGGSAACFKGKFTINETVVAKVTIGACGSNPRGSTYNTGTDGEDTKIVIGTSVNMVAPGGHHAYMDDNFARVGSGTDYTDDWSGVTCTGVTKTSVNNGNAGNGTSGASVANLNYLFGATPSTSWSGIGSCPDGASSSGFVFLKKIA